MQNTMLPDYVFRSCGAGDVGAVTKWLVDGGDVDAHWGRQCTLLMGAATSGQLAMVKLLLSRSASVDLQDVGGFTALMYAALEGHVAVMACLLPERDRGTHWD